MSDFDTRLQKNSLDTPLLQPHLCDNFTQVNLSQQYVPADGVLTATQTPSDAIEVESNHLDQDQDVDQGFPASFFANPFAVSFPGDIPCPGAPLVMVEEQGLCSSELSKSSTAQHCQSQKDMSRHQDTSSSSTMSSRSRLQPIRKPERSRREVSTGLPTNQIYFVDMANKKEAQRIRNTMISRKHRQNKLDRIRELEKKLQVYEKELRRRGENVAECDLQK